MKYYQMEVDNPEDKKSNSLKKETHLKLIKEHWKLTVKDNQYGGDPDACLLRSVAKNCFKALDG